MHRETDVPEERVPMEECFDGPARISSKELAPIHSVKGGTLQNACSTRPRVVADLGKSARMHIVRLINNLVKGRKRMMTKEKCSSHVPCWENLCISSRSYDMEGHAKKCVERNCELANKTTQQLYKVSTPCIDDHHFKRGRNEICRRTQIVLKCFFLGRIGRPDILRSVNKFARSITKWTKSL